MADAILENNLATNLIAQRVLMPAAAGAVPTHVPPPLQAGVRANPIALQALSANDLKLLPGAGGSVKTPAQAVAGVAQQAAAATATVWQSQKSIVNQWTINQDRNSWIGVSGIGWQKLSTASDSGCAALTALAGNAIVTKASVNYRTESDGMVHEMYVF
ncbi:MAG TPA: hypothetical protein VGU23_02750 [Acidobacteriaceae bacterium]|nr:hypothetical protein [Acidobacteriaceae bacterium]